jgi:uncharacterized protein YkwD
MPVRLGGTALLDRIFQWLTPTCNARQDYRLFALTVGLTVLSLSAISQVSSAATTREPAKVFEDFEGETYGDWTLTGSCWGPHPERGDLFRGEAAGFRGSQFACTYTRRLGNAATGRAVSPDFILDHSTLEFLIGGGRYPEQACLNLVVEGKVVKTATGEGFPVLHAASWDVTPFLGRHAHLEIVDETRSSDQGFILVDQIVFTNRDLKASPSSSHSSGNPTDSSPSSGGSADSNVLAAKALTPFLLKTVALINAIRHRNHLPLVAVDPALNAVAQRLADDVSANSRDETIGITKKETLEQLVQPIYGAAPCEETGPSNTGDTSYVELANNYTHFSPFSMHARTKKVPKAMRPDYQVMGIAFSKGAPTRGGRVQWTYWKAVFCDAPPRDGSLLPLSVEAPERRLTGNHSPPLVFPVLKGAKWSNTFGAPRTGHTHQGQDLLAPKMRPLVACFSGTVQLSLVTSGKSSSGNSICLTGDNGWEAMYYHLNCDTPGTRDGHGGARYAFAPGLKSGDHVRAGQFIGYVGDSGNARGGPTHCHFELRKLDSYRLVNPYSYLRQAKILTSAIRSPKESLIKGEIERIQAGVITMKTTRKGATPTLREETIRLPSKSSLPDPFASGLELTAYGVYEKRFSLFNASLLVLHLRPDTHLLPDGEDDTRETR